MTSRVMLSVRVPEYLAHRLKTYAAVSRTPVQELVETAVTEYMDRVDPAGKLKRPPQPESSDARLDRLEGMLEKAIERIGRK
jgi:hypothetical protein